MGIIDGSQSWQTIGNKVYLNVAAVIQDIGTAATEATLAAFKAEAHSDSVDVQALITASNVLLNSISSTLDAFKTEAHDDALDIKSLLNAIGTVLDAFKTANHDDLATLTTLVSAFKTEVHADLLSIQTKIDSTNTKLDTANTTLSAINTKFDVDLSTRASEATLLETNLRIGDETETVAASDTDTSGLNGLFKRFLTRLTVLINFFAANFGASSGAIRTASQIGNANGAADFNSGVPGAQTLRVVANLYDALANALTTRSYASVRPLDVYLPQLAANTVTHTRVTPTANVSTLLLAANLNRKWVVFMNYSGANFFLDYGNAAVINQGEQVSSNGGKLEIGHTRLFLGDINGIVGSNNRTIDVYEGV